MQTQLLVFQPTSFCNIACSYCYLPERNRKNNLTPATVRRTIDLLLDASLIGNKVSVVWHAGEPLALGAYKFAQLIETCNSAMPSTSKVSHHVQTNAMLIDQDWCALLKRLNISVGVSIDGPREVHDVHRVGRNSGGTFDKTMLGVQKLRGAGIPFHAIAVISKESLAAPEALVDFFSTLGATSVGFNVEELEGVNSESRLLEKTADTEFSAFLRTVFEGLSERAPELPIREIEDIAGWVMHAGGTQTASNPQVTPFSIITVLTNGDASTYSPELAGFKSPRHGNFSIGNVNEPYFAFKIPLRMEAMVAEIESGVAHCAASCSYFDYCKGGAPANKYFEKGTFDCTETQYCRTYIKQRVDVVLDMLERRASSKSMI
jgi:uncharacterized protein